MPLGTLFSVSASILRRRAGVLLAFAIVFVAPGALLSAALGGRLGEVVAEIVPISPDGRLPATFSVSTEQTARLLDAAVLLLIASAMAGVLASLGVLCVARIVADDHDGRRSGFASVARTGLGRVPLAIGVIAVTTLVTVLLSGGALAAVMGLLTALPPEAGGGGGPGVFLAIVIGVGLVFALAWISLRWAVALPVAALEAEGVRGTLLRTAHLTGGNMLRTLAVLATGSLVTVVLAGLAAQLLGTLLVDPLAGTDLAWASAVGVSAISQVLFAPIVPVMVAVLYHDLRVRHDAWDTRPATAS